MSKDRPQQKTLEQVAQETMEKIIEYLNADTREEDARREEEREARIAAAFERFRKECLIPLQTRKKHEP